MREMMMMSNILDHITLVNLPPDQFEQTETPKCQLYIHHTASNPSPYDAITWWNTTPEKVGTAFIIGRGNGTTTYQGKPVSWVDGAIIQTFPSKNWAWHLGLKLEHLRVAGSKAKSNAWLNQNSIGIEINNWGPLTKTAKGYTNYLNTVVPDKDVIELTTPWRGFKYFERYTEAQMDFLGELLVFLGQKWNIPTKYQGDRIFDICIDALQGNSGVFTHASVRPDKTDCSPQPILINLLKSI